ncbi:MAG: hypothetical protein LBN24_02355 [Mediterranea sp.]|nr:hypothetical protein [Mediterranea sp.]
MNVRFNNILDAEYGMVRGVVRSISRVSVRSEAGGCYVVEVGSPWCWASRFTYLQEYRLYTFVTTLAIRLSI